MYGFILGIYLVVTIALILIILLQKSQGIALQAKNTGGPRMRANLLTKVTGGLAICFFGLSILLTRISMQESKKDIVLTKQVDKEKADTGKVDSENVSVNKISEPDSRVDSVKSVGPANSQSSTVLNSNSKNKADKAENINGQTIKKEPKAEKVKSKKSLKSKRKIK